jgi:D-3-phosphoglycerate dehydrogenase
MKIIIAERISEKGIEILKEKADVDVRIGIKRDELLKVIGQYDAIIVRSETGINEEFYEKAVNLKVVGRAGNGIDNIELEGATKRGIIVANTPDANTVSAAEHTIGLLLAVARNIPQASTFIKGGQWDRNRFKGVELYGKTVGIVGLGRIGSLVATRLQSFGMRVIAYDPYISDERFERFGVEKIENLNDLVAQCDFLTVHTPKTEETFGMIGEEQFKIAKKGLRTVNCARGGIIDEEALYKALQDGTVAAAAIDVFVEEPNFTSPLLKLDNTVVTPHLGASTVEAQDNVGVTIAHEVLAALEGEMVPNAVNLPTLKHRELEALRPYLSLGEKIAKIYFQLSKDPVEKVEVIYSGEVATHEVKVVTLAVLKGLLEPVLKERVNYVNAALLAESQGITVTESVKSDGENYSTLIRIKLTTKKGISTFAGTVFGKNDLRLVEVLGYEVDAEPTQYMLFVENIDKPGMVGQIGTLLGAGKINIATMQLSRNTKGEKALMILSIDNEIPKEVLQLIRNVDGILHAKVIKL